MAELAESDRIKIKWLYESKGDGIFFGAVSELPASTAEDAVLKQMAEFHEEKKINKPKLKLKILQGTSAYIDDQVHSLEAGREYSVNKEDALILLQMGRATFPDSVVAVELQFKSPCIFNGKSYRQNEVATVDRIAALKLCRQDYIQSIANYKTIEGVKPEQTQQVEKKGLLSKVLG